MDDPCGAACANTIIIHAMNQAFASSAQRRDQGADYGHESMRLGHQRNLETVSFREATGQRVVTEAGSGRTRAETNAPAGTAAGG